MHPSGDRGMTSRSADERRPLADQFREHFGHRDHLYGELLTHLADDLDTGGPTAEICRGHLDARRGDAVQLRLLAGIHRIVLRGDASELARCYPNLGGTTPRKAAWPLLRPLLEARVEELRAALDQPPQTNEVGRSACLAIGLFDVVRRHGGRRIRLLEPGASAGLNLNLDRYRFIGPGWSWGPAESPLVIDTDAAGVRPEAFEVVERRGCDLAPVDAAGEDGARYLTSFVWPFDAARHERLAAALAVARRHPVTVDDASAETWLSERLAEPVSEDVLTVVWTSITQQYWPAAVSAAVEEAVARARTRIPVVHVSMEGVPPVQTTAWSVAEHGPDLRVDGDPIARSHHHGPPILLRAP